ncbi:MAG: hypothetical protein DWQ42_12930 [Planctomycetota bacterium]|mgnify:CR=1 FL=1|nr:MAG: hypothetical protein DWQ42_12930 [Planctomycetota bacterium]REK49407.1 MAG: hypothetical protein DWQ46_00210 [Planctomycetota bacterium]
MLEGRRSGPFGQAAVKRQLPGDEGKLPRMLAAATAMIQVTWLPHPPSAESEPLPTGALFEPTLVNMEHLAAASAAVQNLLLAATACGVPTYWSSGGALREAEAFKLLGIPRREIALGSVLLFPADDAETPGIEHVPGKLRDKRGGAEDFSRRVEL